MFRPKEEAETMRIKRMIRLALIGVCAVILLIVGSAFTYEQASRFIALWKYDPDGELVDVGGHKIHMVRQGSESPTVIFESGLDTLGHLSWYKVQEEVSEFATTLSYDRAGILWSERGDQEKSTDSMAADLEKVLVSEGFPKPYIVVGHSVAGITSRTFINRNQDEIAGVVFVDASHPDQAVSSPPSVPPEFMMSLMINSGLVRMTSGRIMPNTEAEDRINVISSALTHRSTRALLDEAEKLVAMSNSASSVNTFGDIPLIVISATGLSRNIPEDSSESVQEVLAMRETMQQDLLTLSRSSEHILAEESTHYVQLEQPEIVIDAIQRLTLSAQGN